MTKSIRPFCASCKEYTNSLVNMDLFDIEAISAIDTFNLLARGDGKSTLQNVTDIIIHWARELNAKMKNVAQYQNELNAKSFTHTHTQLISIFSKRSQLGAMYSVHTNKQFNFQLNYPVAIWSVVAEKINSSAIPCINFRNYAHIVRKWHWF